MMKAIMNENHGSNKTLSVDQTNFLFFLFKWRKLLFIISFSAAILSAGASLLIKNKYKATVIMFPTSTNSVSKALISTTYGLKEDLNEFGEEEQAEQMLQILHSNEIRARIIEEFNLLEHYDIDPESKYKYTKLYNQYNSNISFSRTEYMAVEINVIDEDPEIAAAIANEIANLYDTVKNNLQKQRTREGFLIVQRTYLEMEAEIQWKEDSLTILRKHGIHDYESQAERLNEAWAREVGKGNMLAAKLIENKLDTLAKYGSAYVSLRDALEYEKKMLTEMRAKYEEAKVDAEQVIPQKFVVDYAITPEKKSYPVRWLIVLLSTFATFITCIIGIILYENFKKFKSLT